jgi:hypothetical protein
MLYLNTITGAYGVSFADAIRQHTGASVPQGTAAFGDFKGYTPVSRPAYHQVTEMVSEAAPIGGTQQWVVFALPAETIARNQLQARTVALSLNNAVYEDAIASLTAGYPPSEIATWERQREEAVAWNADNAVATPWINIAAQARGIPRTEYLSRTYAKATQFAHASAYLTGLRQRYESAINVASDPSTVATNYDLPGAP